MNKHPNIDIRKYPTEYCQNQKNEHLCKNHSNISIHNQSKIRKGEFLPQTVHEKDIGQSSYLFTPVYQTLKAENYIENFHYQPSINIIGSKTNKIDEKILSRQNSEISLKPQTSFNGSIVNKFGKNNNNIINESFKDKTLKPNFNHQLYTEISLTYNNNNINNKSINRNPNIYKNLYLNKYQTFKSPENYLVKKIIYNGDYSKINKSSKYSAKNIALFANQNSSNNDKRNKSIIEKKNHFEKKINNSKNKIKFEIKTPKNLENNKLKKLQVNDEKSKRFDNSSKSINIKEKKNNNFNNNFFNKIEINSTINKNRIIDRQKNMRIENQSFKSTKDGNSRNTNILLFRKKNNLKLNYFNNSNKNSCLFLEKGIEILKKLIENRKYKNWISLKYKLLKQKSYSNKKPHKSIGKIKNQIEQSKGINFQNQSINNLDIDTGFIKNFLLNDKKEENNSFLLKTSVNSKEGDKELLKENFRLQNINSVIIQENKELFKKLEDMKEKNKIFSKSQRTNNLMIENKILNHRLKQVYTKYLTCKKIYNNNLKLKGIFNQFNKKSFIISYNEEKKLNLLHRLINIKKRCNKDIIRKYFLIFYFNTKFQNNKNKENIIIENFQKKLAIKQKMLNIFYKKEKKLFSNMKKYFDKFYYNSKIKEIKLNYEIIENENIIINNTKEKNNFDIRNRKLKIIIENIIKNNNIILRSIFKQWILRTKIINMKIKLVKEENMKKIINPIEKLIKNKSNKNDINFNNNLKTDNLIKGIEKLSDIFLLYKSANKNKSLNDHQEIKDENSEVDTNDNNKREYLINKIYGNKYNDDWIIEEKEEEQIDENGESTSAKNDTEKINEENVINIYDFSNNKSNFENNNGNFENI